MYEIELAVIGSLMLWRSDLYPMLSSIEYSDFSNLECREILFQMKEQPIDIDQTVLLAPLSVQAKTVLITACQTYARSQSSFNSYLIKLKEYAKSRRIKDSLYEIIVDTMAIVNTNDLLKIIQQEGNDEFLLSYAKKAKDSLKGFAERAALPAANIKTGWTSIDRTINGLRLSSVSIVGAPPSTGKTAFAINIVAHQLTNNLKMVFFSLEMSFDMILERLFAIFNNVDYSIFHMKEKTPKQLTALQSFQDILSCLELYVFDDIYDIEMQNTIISEIKPSLVVVDYIQKVTSKRKSENRRTEVEYISSQYKQIAKYNNCHIMLLSQLARTQNGAAPTMRDLKESGALEADGDYIMILNRPFVGNKDKYPPELTYLLIDKNKFGKTGMLQMAFDGGYQKFREVDYTHDI